MRSASESADSPSQRCASSCASDENLRGLRVGAIYEHEWRKGIDESEPSELPRVELPMRIAADDAVDHDENSVVLRSFGELTERVGERRASFVDIEMKQRRHGRRCVRDSSTRRQRSNERDRFLAGYLSEGPIPVLALLALINRVEQVGARPWNTRVSHRPEIRYGHLFFGGFVEEEEADRRMCGAGESSSCFKVGDVRPCSHSSSFGKRWARLAASTPERSFAQASSSRLTSTRATTTLHFGLWLRTTRTMRTVRPVGRAADGVAEGVANLGG